MRFRVSESGPGSLRLHVEAGYAGAAADGRIDRSILRVLFATTGAKRDIPMESARANLGDVWTIIRIDRAESVRGLRFPDACQLIKHAFRHLRWGVMFA